MTKRIERIEFSVTFACTGKCRHCSVGERTDGHIATDKAVSVVETVGRLHTVESVMTFGGEPLLYADTVCAVHSAATRLGIPKRQIITNGFFSKDDGKIAETAERLKQSGINSLLISVDTFHFEHIPFEPVYAFAKACKELHIEGLSLHPAWAIGRGSGNKYDDETEKCLELFAPLNIPVSEGNVIFPSGNAVKYLPELFKKTEPNMEFKCGDAPYTSPPDEISCISVNPNGDVYAGCFKAGNCYRTPIDVIIDSYDPYKNPLSAAVLRGGIRELTAFSKSVGIEVDTENKYSPCEICRETSEKYYRKKGADM